MQASVQRPSSSSSFLPPFPSSHSVLAHPCLGISRPFRRITLNYVKLSISRPSLIQQPSPAAVYMSLYDGGFYPFHPPPPASASPRLGLSPSACSSGHFYFQHLLPEPQFSRIPRPPARFVHYVTQKKRTRFAFWTSFCVFLRLSQLASLRSNYAPTYDLW